MFTVIAAVENRAEVWGDFDVVLRGDEDEVTCPHLLSPAFLQQQQAVLQIIQHLYRLCYIRATRLTENASLCSDGKRFKPYYLEGYTRRECAGHHIAPHQFLAQPNHIPVYTEGKANTTRTN